MPFLLWGLLCLPQMPADTPTAPGARPPLAWFGMAEQVSEGAKWTEGVLTVVWKGLAFLESSVHFPSTPKTPGALPDKNVGSTCR